MCHASRIPLASGVPMLTVVLLLTACIGKDLIRGGGAALTGDPFSADIVDPAHPEKPASHVYFGNGKVRIESGDTDGLGALVLDPSKGSTLIVNDRQKVYIDAGMFAQLVMVGATPVLRVLRPAGSGDPCTQWNSMLDPFAAFRKHDDSKTAPHFTCKSLGSESVNGRPAHKWMETSNDPDDRGSTIWIDDRLHIMARSQDGANGDEMEIRNIKEGPQPEALFEAPAGYKKVGITSILGGMLNGNAGKGQPSN
jgi:hypothetical protein